MSRSNWKGDILSLLAGCLLPLAFAPFGWWVVAVFCLWLLIYLICQVSVKKAAWRGFLFGLGYFGVGVSWVYVSIRLFGNADMLLAVGITILFVSVLSLYIALVCYVFRYLTLTGPEGLGLLIFPAIWLLVEWLRGWLFTGFGWLQLGYAFIDSPLSAYAPWIGATGLGFLASLTAVSLFILSARTAQMWLKLVSVPLLALVWAVPLFIGFPDMTRPQGEAVKAALVQGNIPQYRKWLSSEREPTLEMYRKLTQGHWDKDIVVWPETAIPAFEDEVPVYMDTMHQAAQSSDTILMTGLPVRETHSGNYYNALAVLGNLDRGTDSVYQKRHLVPFGEYLPFKSLLDPVLNFLQIPMSDFSAGEAPQPLVRAGRNMAGVFICYEIAFAADVLEAMPQASYLVNISNDAWFGDSLAPHQHLQVARMRALETGRYVLRSTNTGITAIIDDKGRVQTYIRQFVRDIAVGRLQPRAGSTGYASVYDYPLLILSTFIVLLTYRRARRS